MIKLTVDELNEIYKEINKLHKEGKIKTSIVTHTSNDSEFTFEFDRSLGKDGKWILISEDVEVIDDEF